MRRAPSFLGPSAVLTRFSWALGVELVKINHYKAPRDKLICILNCCKVIFGPPCSPFSFYCLSFCFLFSGLSSLLYRIPYRHLWRRSSLFTFDFFRWGFLLLLLRLLCVCVRLTDRIDRVQV